MMTAQISRLAISPFALLVAFAATAAFAVVAGSGAADLPLLIDAGRKRP